MPHDETVRLLHGGTPGSDNFASAGVFKRAVFKGSTTPA